MKIVSLSKQFSDLKVLDRFSLELPDRGIVALMGPSGSGKTTLLSIISGALPADSGIVEKRGNCSAVFQEDRLLPWINVLENVEIVLDKKCQGKGIGLKLLDEIGLSGTESQSIQSLSGGMQRRVSICRALAYDAPLLLMDEPFKGLDTAIKKQVMDVMARHSRARLVLLVTHDLQETLYLADELYILEGPPLRIKKHCSIPEPQNERGEDFYLKYQNLMIDLKNHRKSSLIKSK